MPDSPFAHFLNQSNTRMVKLLEQNTDVSAFVYALLDHLVIYCEHAGVEYKNIKLRDTHISADGQYVKARIGT